MSVFVCGGGGVGALVAVVSVVAVVAVVFVVSVVSVFCGGGAGFCCGAGYGFVFVMITRGGCCGCVVVITRGGGAADVIGGGITGRGAPTGGIVPAIVPGGSVPVVSTFGASVKLLVVSALVFVIGGVVSPGALMVEETPLACPSWTT